MQLDKIKSIFNGNLNSFKPIPFWSWNGKLEKEELCRQIDWMHENGIGGFFMHARGGLKTEYLSDEWMECTEVCAEHAEKLGMDAWMYDENGWPSGFAGGKLLEDPNNCDKFIEFKKGEFDPDATVSYFLEKDSMKRVYDGSRRGEYLNLYIRTSPSTADILNPQVVDKFINLTHEAYKKRFGNEFPQKICGFFTDEPQYQRWNTPFTDMLTDYFEENYGEDIFEKLGLLFVEKDGYLKFRYRYWCAMQQLMLHSYSEKIYNWCKENEVKFTGHYVEEVSLTSQLWCCAGVMPFYKYMDMPGIDWLASDADNIIPPRQLASVAAQYGKKQTLTESFGCCGWQASPRDVKRVADFQFLNGVNTLCQHLLPYEEYGQRKKDHPAHYSKVNPWVEREFLEFNLYFTRLGALLSASKEKINAAVLHPIRSAYFEYKRCDEASFDALDRDFREDCEMLNSVGLQYHFLDETLLCDDGFVNGNKIGCGKCEYEYLILPHILTVSASTEKLLREYADNGGKILIIGNLPAFIEAEPYGFEYLTENCTLEEILSAQPFRKLTADNNIYNTYREYDGVEYMMIMNADRYSPHKAGYNFDGNIKSFKKLDLITLEETRLPLEFNLEAGESVLVFPDTEEYTAENQPEEYRFILDRASVDFDKNMLTLDTVRYSLDGENYSEEYPCPGLFAKLLDERFEGYIYLKYEFDVRKIPELIRIAAEDCKAEEYSLNGNHLEFNERSEKEKNLLITDITELVREGKNCLEVKLYWYQDEKIYYALYGENVTESLKNCIAYSTELEPVYISGKFGVYTDVEYKKGKESCTVYGNKFYIGDVPETVTEPTVEGFPFFAGSLRCRQKVELSTENTLLRIEGSWHIAYITVNGRYAGKLIYDRTLDISGFAHKGENTVEIEFIISNRNLLGPHHQINRNFNSYTSPYSFELTGSWHDGKSEVYSDDYCLLKLDCK